MAGLFLMPLFAAAASTTSAPIVDVMSLNVRLDLPADTAHSWATRREPMVALIKERAPDFVGTQELLPNQLQDLQERLPEYAVIGVGRDDGMTGGEHCSIFYRKDRFELLKTSTFWLSEHPEQVGVRGWDAAYNRIATWGRFREKASGHVFIVLSTHFDNEGVQARRESVKLLLDRVHWIANGHCAIVMGDFNAVPQSEVYSRLTSGCGILPKLYDTRLLAQKSGGPGWTFHGFGSIPEDEREQIDYIFVNKPLVVFRSEHIAPSTTEGAPLMSDHVPVVARISLSCDKEDGHDEDDH